jgi:hypothetical protein
MIEVCVQQYEDSLFTLHLHLHTWPELHFRVYGRGVEKAFTAAYMLLRTVHDAWLNR